MSTILAIETSTEIASVALLHDGKLWQQAASGVQNHSLSVLPMLQTLLQQAGLALSSCHAIAFGAGPGSFTGVRTACGLAQGLAFGLNLPVLPVSTLLALAEAMRLANPINPINPTEAPIIMPILDARMGEVYWAQYRYQDGWHEVLAPALAKPQDLSFDGQIVPCGNGASLCGVEIGVAPQLPHAAQIAQLGALALAQGLGLDAAQAQPFYLRNKVAQTSAERLQSRSVA